LTDTDIAQPCFPTWLLEYCQGYHEHCLYGQASYPLQRIRGICDRGKDCPPNSLCRSDDGFLYEISWKFIAYGQTAFGYVSLHVWDEGYWLDSGCTKPEFHIQQ